MIRHSSYICTEKPDCPGCASDHASEYDWIIIPFFIILYVIGYGLCYLFVG